MPIPENAEKEPMMGHKLSFAAEKKLPPPALDLDIIEKQQASEVQSEGKTAVCVPIPTTWSTPLVEDKKDDGVMSGLLGMIGKQMSNTNKDVLP